MPRIRHLFVTLITTMTILLTGCVSQPEEPSHNSIAPAVAGKVESVSLPGMNIKLPALMDTGASISVLDVDEYILKETPRGDRIQFSVQYESLNAPVSFDLPVVRYTSVLTGGGTMEKKPVVNLDVNIGPVSGTAEFMLAKRDDRLLPVVIGRNFLSGRLLIDPGSRQRLTKEIPAAADVLL